MIVVLIVTHITYTSPKSVHFYQFPHFDVCTLHIQLQMMWLADEVRKLLNWSLEKLKTVSGA